MWGVKSKNMNINKQIRTFVWRNATESIGMTIHNITADSLIKTTESNIRRFFNLNIKEQIWDSMHLNLKVEIYEKTICTK